ncbi:MAG: hypothetical protein PHG75_01510 [Syntrophomonas sp.]|nr:hypothetical protein [Syntrophomonas sp.]
MTFTPSTYTIYFYGATNATLTTAAKTFYNLHCNKTTGSSLTLQDDYTGRGMYLISGTLDINEKTVNIGVSGGAFSIDNSPTSGAVLDITNATINLTSNCGSVMANVANVTINASGSTINCAGTTNSIIIGTTSGAGKTMGDLVVNSSSSVTLNGSNTWTSITVQPGKTLNLTSGTTQTISDESTFGDAGTASIVKAVTTDSVATLSMAAGKYVWARNCAINDIAISGSGPGYYSDGSTVDAQSTGWTSGAPRTAADSLLVKITESASVETGFTLTAVQDGTHIDLSWT